MLTNFEKSEAKRAAALFHGPNKHGETFDSIISRFCENQEAEEELPYFYLTYEKLKKDEDGKAFLAEVTERWKPTASVFDWDKWKALRAEAMKYVVDNDCRAGTIVWDHRKGWQK